MKVSRPPDYSWLVAILVILLMVVSIGSAWVVAHRRRHFAHVEDDWPPTERHVSASGVASEPILPVPLPQVFRTHCSEALERAGWSTKIAFPGDGTGPDIVGRRETALLAVRCRPSAVAIGSEMVNEAALMGTRQPGSVVLLVSNAPFSEPAKAEAIRQRVHLLHDSELPAFVG